MRLDLAPGRVAELALKGYPHGLSRPAEGRAVYVSQAGGRIVNAAVRLLELMAQPDEARLLAPLVVDEILIRLLLGPVGPREAQVGLAEFCPPEVS